MKRILLIATLLIAGFTATAQPYNWSVGLRGGVAGVSLVGKHYFNEKNSLDLAASLFYKGWGFEFSGLYEWNLPVTDGLNFYYGPGAQIGALPAGEINAFCVGVEGVAGLEYKFASAPIALFFDYRPRITITVGSGVGFGYLDFGLGVKFCF